MMCAVVPMSIFPLFDGEEGEEKVQMKGGNLIFCTVFETKTTVSQKCVNVNKYRVFCAFLRPFAVCFARCKKLLFN